MLVCGVVAGETVIVMEEVSGLPLNVRLGFALLCFELDI